MRQLRWLAIGCGAAVGMVLAFVAGVWCMKPAGEKTADATPTITKTTPAAPATMLKGDYQTLSHKPDIPLRPVNDPPKVPVELPKPVGLPPLPAAVPAPPPQQSGGAPLPAIDLAPLPVVPVEARAGGTQSEALIPPIPPIVPAAEPTPASAPVTKPAPPSAPAAKGPPVQYVSKPELEFEYDVGKKGKSGVKTVSLFVRNPNARQVAPKEKSEAVPTRDWRAVVHVDVKEESTSRLRYVLPADGRYEFRLGVTSGNGNVSKPKETDTADMVVVLDTRPPDITRFEAAIDPATNTVMFRLDLSENNLDNTKSAVIEYRNPGVGQWQAVRLKEMSWPIPADAPAEVAFRVTVTDLAGNVAIKVIDRLNLDTTIPEGKLTKVRTVDSPRKEEAPHKKEEAPLPSALPSQPSPGYPTLDLTPKK